MGAHAMTLAPFAARPDAGIRAQFAKGLIEVAETYPFLHVQQRDWRDPTAFAAMLG